MKKIILLALLFIAGYTAQAQQNTWKEMDEFHAVMSATFHPAEENNLRPLKEKSGELLTKAKAWKESAVPAGYNAAIVSPILHKLVKQCKGIQKSVSKNKPDSTLKSRITEAHDTFHEIMEKCRNEKH